MTLVWNLFCVQILKCFSRIYAIFSGLRHSTKRNCLGDLIQSIQHVSESLGIWDLPQSPGRSLWNGCCCSPITGWRWQRRSLLRWLLWGHGGQGMVWMTVQRCSYPACNSPSWPFYRLNPPANRDDHSFSPHYKARASKKEIQLIEPSHNTTTCSVSWMDRACTRGEVCAWGFMCWVPSLAKSLREESIKKLEYQCAKRPMLVTYTELVPKEIGSYETVNLTSWLYGFLPVFTLWWPLQWRVQIRGAFIRNH